MSYGCYNRQPFKPAFKAQDGEKQVFVEFKMTKDCQYKHTELGKKDPKCVGCLWKSENLV